MSLHAGQLLAPVVAPLASHLGPLDRLAVEAPGTGARLPAVRHPDLLPEGVPDPLPSAVVPPRGEVVVDRALGRQVMREHVPLAARAVEVEEGVEHLPHPANTHAKVDAKTEEC